MILKELRLKTNNSQTEIAKKLNIPRVNYNRYELGTVEPDIKTLIKLADFFCVSLDYLCEHKTKNILDLSGYNENQKGIIFTLEKLSERNQIILLGYILHMLEEQTRNQ